MGMDNKLMENCIREVLQDESYKGNDVMLAAKQLSDFHELLDGSDHMFEGFKLYSRVNNRYYGKLEDLGIVGSKDDDDD